MRWLLIGAATGVILLHTCERLPDPGALALATLACALVAWRRPSPLSLGLAGVAAGLAYAAVSAQSQLDHRLPAAEAGRDRWITGEVVGLPRDEGYRQVFYLDLERWSGAGDPRRIRLSWYGAETALAPGERWRLRVRLRAPRGLMNPGAFDYERWLFANGIDATGYVRPEGGQRLGQRLTLDGVRAALADRVTAAADDHDSWVRALAVADRRGLAPGHWEVLNATGTSHLMAISGLHIGLSAGLGALLGGWAWRRHSSWCERMPARTAGVFTGLLAALGYAALAGFGLPTQRALVMTAVAALALGGRRHVRPFDALLWALAAVLLWDPRTPLSAGFWLSFWAVVVLVMAGTAARHSHGRWLTAQLAVTLGLFPILAAWFGELPLLSPLANMVAVPWVSLVVVPLVLAGLVALPLSSALSAWLWQGAGAAMDGLFHGLAWAVDALPGLGVSLPGLPLWAVALACAGVAALCLPGRWGARLLALGLLLPLAGYAPPGPAPGTARVTVLDVGQGTAVLVETAGHALVYDTGPRLGARLDTARAAVLPVLRQRGWARLDALVLSHGDSDHSAGAATLAEAVPIGRVWAGEPGEAAIPARACRKGRHWRWDGVTFRFLHPDGDAYTGNDASCVLRIATDGAAALLTGDITRGVERRLLADNGAMLASDLLLVPHHGSASSSTPAFVAAVAPVYAVFSTGHGNPYGLPALEVSARYAARGARLLNTAETGALTFLMSSEVSHTGSWRRAGRRYFHAGGDTLGRP